MRPTSMPWRLPVLPRHQPPAPSWRRRPSLPQPQTFLPRRGMVLTWQPAGTTQPLLPQAWPPWCCCHGRRQRHHRPRWQLSLPRHQLFLPRRRTSPGLHPPAAAAAGPAPQLLLPPALPHAAAPQAVGGHQPQRWRLLPQRRSALSRRRRRGRGQLQPRRKIWQYSY
uniref:Uncharacterized protein n=1 Tax=Alexandrium monilatum TaxID=311494 RepID=A0A7S4UY58_9DINO